MEFSLGHDHRMSENNMVLWWGLALFVGSIGGWFEHAYGQEVLLNQVSITTDHSQIFAMTSGEGISRHRLKAGEQIVTIESKGLTGFVHTSTRLLGFSGNQQRWVALRIAPSEQILSWMVMPRMIVVQGQDAVYGFQSRQARWKREVWGAGETELDHAIEDHVALFVTNRRALAFSAFTGGFFAEDLPVVNPAHEIQINDNIVILHLSDRQLVFRSGLAIWAELP